MMDRQIVLEPDMASVLGENDDAYALAKWRWMYQGEMSAWFDSRDEAGTDAASKHPGVGIG